MPTDEWDGYRPFDPATSAIWECEWCYSLVTEDSRWNHQHWHRQLDEMAYPSE